MGEVCVIGAGGAGLAAAKALDERDVAFTVLEAGSDVGGLWRYENDSGYAGAYASLRTNTSRRRTGFACHPLPPRGPAFLHHTAMLDYLESFTDRFKLREHIRFRTRVATVRPMPGDEDWEIRTTSGESARFRAVIVASGFSRVPRLPRLPGQFDGLQMHTREYRTPEPFAGRDVVIVGLGSSAAEIACELRRVARSVTIAARSGTWVLPRRLAGVPIDLLDTRRAALLPRHLRRRAVERIVKLAAGDIVAAGLPAPDVRPGAKPFTISDELIGCVRRGEVRITGGVEALEGDHVRIAGGEELSADALLFATGYDATCRFLPVEVEPPRGDRAPLYRGVASPVASGLFFVGLARGHGGVLPMFEAQAQWIADVLAGRLLLPGADAMLDSIARDDAVRRRDFDPRFGYLFDRVRYIQALDREARAAQRYPGLSPRAALATLD